MIRTRDFILFVVTLLFLAVAIVSTVAVKNAGEHPQIQQLAMHEGTSPAGASSEEITIDRNSIIARLREKIRNSDLTIVPEPSVEAEVVPTTTQATATSTATLFRCVQPDDALAIVPQWPLTDVQINLKEGARLVYVEDEIVIPDVEPGEETTQSLVKTLLQLPVVPAKATQPYCVPSEVIGVTQRGVLMFNGDMRSYRNVPENVQIGYARDGFPIYGVYEGQTDECGGYEHAAGYRYTVSKNRDYVIGCFVAAPQPFSL